MNLKTAALLLACVLTPGICAAQSQPLKSGTWTGSVTPPEGETTLVTYDVAVLGDSLTITIHAGEHGDFVTTEGRYADGKIMFKFAPGPTVSCTLAKDEKGTFAGSCFEDGGSEAKITMVPPSA